MNYFYPIFEKENTSKRMRDIFKEFYGEINKPLPIPNLKKYTIVGHKINTNMK